MEAVVVGGSAAGLVTTLLARRSTLDWVLQSGARRASRRPVGTGPRDGAAVTAQIAPWYADQAAADSARLASIRRALRGEPPVPLPDLAGGVTPAHLVAAAMVDPDLYRVFASLIGMLRRPSDVYGDPDTAARVRAVCAAADVSPPGLGPSRADLLAALG